MKKINVIVKDKNTLVLSEDGKKDDYIDLSDLSTIDTTNILNLIDEGKDKVYAEKLNEYKRNLDLEKENLLIQTKSEYQKKIDDLNNLLLQNKESNEASLVLQKETLSNDYLMQIKDLENKLQGFEEKKKADMDSLKAMIALENQKDINSLKAEYEDKIKDLNALIHKQEEEKNRIAFDNDLDKQKMQALNNSEIEKLKNQINLLTTNQQISLENEKMKIKEMLQNEIMKLSNELAEVKNKALLDLNQKELEFTKKYNDMELSYKSILQTKENEYLALKRQKAALNVKQTGEDLEAWCDNEMKAYRQIGFANTTWVKDNDVIKEEGESKGSKADYIFRVYASDSLKETEEIASVCLDMKDENPDSVNKQTNEHYFKALDKNRDKKKCVYAVLVSNLEMDRPNDVPIWKAEGYENMYVVRPAYMITFLSMVASLSYKFREIILKGKQEKLELLSSIELKEKFEEIKLKYLDKPLEGLSGIVDNIRKSSEGIKKLCQKIDDDCDKATRNYLNEIQNKLAKFDIEVDKAYRKYDKSVK